MATNKNITMKQFNGTDYDTLYPATLGSQIITPVPVSAGGTGVNTNPSLLVNLGSGSADAVFQNTPRPGVTGILPVENGGTGINVNPNIHVNLGAENTSSVFDAYPRPGVYGILPVGHGGTGVTSYAALAGQLSPFITSGARWTLKLEQDFFVGPSGSGGSTEYSYNISNFCPAGSKVIICVYSRDGYQTSYSGSSFATVSITRGNVNYVAIELTSNEPSTSDGVCENFCIAEFPGYAGGKYFGTILGYSATNVWSSVIDTTPVASGVHIRVNRRAFSPGGGNHVLIKVFQYS